MTITNPTPIIIPPTPQQEFPHLWLSDIGIHAPTAENGFIHIETRPYNQDTKAIGSHDYHTVIRTDNLWAAVNEVPEVAEAMFAIFQAIDPLRAWLNGGTSNVVTVPDPIEVEDVAVTTLDPIEVEDVVATETIEE